MVKPSFVHLVNATLVQLNPDRDIITFAGSSPLETNKGLETVSLSKELCVSDIQEAKSIRIRWKMNSIIVDIIKMKIRKQYQSARKRGRYDRRLSHFVCSVAVFEFLRHLEAGALAQQIAPPAE